MQQIRLIHWNAAEAQERATWLRASGYEVDPTPFAPSSLRAMRENPPGAVVIDLGRLPSQGRDAAILIRKDTATRHVPLVFVDGAPAKVARIREILPDAVYASWDQIGDALAHAIAHPPADPIVLGSLFDVYAGTPLLKKLGIATGSKVALIGAPEGFEDTLSALPDGVVLTREAGVPCDLTLWFVRSRAELERDIAQVSASIGSGGLWIIWPKRSSGVSSDLSQAAVREVGLASGLVDYKVCAVDATWSGLRFTRRKPPAG
ncbi:MAG: hypothetical protein ISS56_18430 [Anaerolineae bacterium]|nr:hypothetical protein [Anaerolineae bacterium]